MTREIKKKENVPAGLCQCGCGLPAPVPKRNQTRDGMVKGRPMKYIRGHAQGTYETDRRVAAYKSLMCRRRYGKEQRERLRKYVDEYLSTHPCVDCGEPDILVLDFDHRNPKEKHKTISQIIAFRIGIHILEKEIAKCDVRCANCHRRRHYIEHHSIVKENKCRCGKMLEDYQHMCVDCWIQDKSL